MIIDLELMLIQTKLFSSVCQNGEGIFKVMKKDNPSVGLVNIGEEEEKEMN